MTFPLPEDPKALEVNAGSPHAAPSAAAQTLQAELEGHAQAQSQLSVRAHNLAAKAQVHAAMQAAASAQAQAAAQEAHHLEAAAQQLQAEAHIVGNSETSGVSIPSSQALMLQQHDEQVRCRAISWMLVRVIL